MKQIRRTCEGGGGDGSNNKMSRFSFMRRSRSSRGFYISTRVAVVFLTFTSTLLFLQLRTLLIDVISPSSSSDRAALFAPQTTNAILAVPANNINQLRATHTTTKARSANDVAGGDSSSLALGDEAEPNNSHPNNEQQCTLFLAKSAVSPDSGLGVFTSVGLHPGDVIGGVHDICIFVNDLERPVEEWLHLRTHTWGRGMFFGQHEARISRAACEGLVTNVNTMPDQFVNTRIMSSYLPTNAGLSRKDSPGSGAIRYGFI